MKTIFENIKKAFKAFLENYMNAMEMYGEALSKGRGCSCAEGGLPLVHQNLRKGCCFKQAS